MDEKKDILEETTIENPVENDLSQAPTPAEEIAPAPASEQTEALKAASEAERKFPFGRQSGSVRTDQILNFSGQKIEFLRFAAIHADPPFRTGT